MNAYVFPDGEVYSELPSYKSDDYKIYTEKDAEDCFNIFAHIRINFKRPDEIFNEVMTHLGKDGLTVDNLAPLNMYDLETLPELGSDATVMDSSHAMFGKTGKIVASFVHVFHVYIVIGFGFDDGDEAIMFEYNQIKTEVPNVEFSM